MKILFIHRVFDESGVVRSVLNNVRGLRELSNEIEFIFAGSYFVPSIPEYVEKRYIDWNAINLSSQIKEIAEDADFVIIENPTIGDLPKATLAFKEFAEENTNKKIIYRIHDFIDDRPHLFDEFRKVFDNFEDIYPVSGNVAFLALTSFDKKRLVDKGLKNVSILPNSLIISDLSPNIEKTQNFREVLEKEKIINPGEKILAYPVRILKRKNIEEAMLITKLLNETGENYRLIVTLPYEENYKKELECLSAKYGIPCSIGIAWKYINFNKTDNFTIADLYAISDLVISTSVMEGFGFTFIEPWVSGASLIGRKIPEITKDFEEAGIDLSALYDNSVLHNSKNSEERMNKVKAFLSDNKERDQLQGTLRLSERIKKSSSLIEKNKEAIIKNYGHTHIAGKLLNHINLILGN